MKNRKSSIPFKKKIAEANDKFTSGEGMDDHEIELLLNYYYDLVRRMHGILGDEFALMTSEFSRRGELLDRIKHFRRSK